MGNSGQEGAWGCLTPRTARAALLPQERFFSPFDICSILDPTAEEGRALLWHFAPGFKSESFKKEPNIEPSQKVSAAVRRTAEV